jgi:S-adenosylmethionine:tRNA ribosyltransferase-isomerase
MGPEKQPFTEIDRYDFDLPRELIAQEPLAERTNARMLVVDRITGEMHHSLVRNLPDWLSEGDALVMNDSKVIRARMFGTRAKTKGRWEGLYLRSDSTGVAEMLSKTRGTLESGETIVLTDSEGRRGLPLVVVGRNEGHLLVKPVPRAGIDLTSDWLEIMEQYGRVPLPPYIRDGQMVTADVERYQTVYARSPGSVAAPTAGLHFTPELIKQCRVSGQFILSVTLHVGVGTFRPIQTETLAEHQMHSEFGELSQPVADRLNLVENTEGRVIAVGTTSLRVLETAAAKSDGAVLKAWSGETDLFVRPGYQFRCVDGLLTNFHLPKSSLLVLVSTLMGYDLCQEVYQTAIAEGYRFYSYGDCMLII